MMMNIDENTRVIDLTVGQLFEYLSKAVKGSNVNDYTTKEKKYVYGITGIATLFNCSVSTANRIKSSGVINQAISQNGRTIVVDADLAIKLFNNR